MAYIGYTGVANQAQTTPGCALSVVVDASSAGYGNDDGGSGVVDTCRFQGTRTCLLYGGLEGRSELGIVRAYPTCLSIRHNFRERLQLGDHSG